MKIYPFKIPKSEHTAIILQEDVDIIFYDKLHQHEEIQISYIVKGQGTLIVGDTANHYRANDVLIIGSNLPHVFKSDVFNSKASHMLSLFFTKTSFGKDFFNLEELKSVSRFFKRSVHGFKITSKKKDIYNLFFQINTASKLDRVIIFLKILKNLSSCSYSSLSSFVYEKKYTEIEGKRMQNVFEFTMSHFSEEISLETVSAVANMTKNAFCKYFKKRTNKTYFRFLNELRIEHACKSLHMENELPIAEIAYKSGFNNISNFNRQFQKIKGQSPSLFRQLNPT